ncbi:hypothetical protein EYF80_006331 [Liparis tanakae]|uniref:Uncharacterized protein n=1 Tax=Liparis tanakae TaxID=230148 RepID=A0A4Z2IZE1_9TELE|nr:hypothetical protein EYF80_006331 [Liparis tanakae]
MFGVFLSRFTRRIRIPPESPVYRHRDAAPEAGEADVLPYPAETHLVLNVGVDPLQHPLTGVLIGQEGLHLQTQMFTQLKKQWESQCRKRLCNERLPRYLNGTHKVYLTNPAGRGAARDRRSLSFWRQIERSVIDRYDLLRTIRSACRAGLWKVPL